MANISIIDLRPAGADLFDSSESYLQEISDMEFSGTNGGITPVIFLAGVGVGIYISKKYL
jgi:hypothetical protein